MGKISNIGLLLDNILSLLVTLESDRSKDQTKLVSYLQQTLPDIGLPIGADLKHSQLRKAVLFSRAYLEVIFDHYPQVERFKAEELLSVVGVSYHWTDFEKTAKWVLSAPMAKHLRQDELADGLPPLPTDKVHLFAFSPPLKRYFDKVIRNRKSPRVLHFCSSLLLGVKRACAEPDQEMVQKTLKKHSEALGKRSPELKLNFRSYFRRTLTGVEHFKCGPLKDTGGASYQTTRSLGGKFEEVVRQFNGCSFSEPLFEDQLYFIDSNQKEFYGRLVPSYSDIRALVAEVDCVKAVGLLEALKVRVITTGDAATSVYLEQHRKRLHDFLRKVDCLKALGAPKITESDLRDLCRKEVELGCRFTHWVSGDYSAATDNLNMAVTEQCVDIICQMLDCTEDRDIFARSLTRTQLKYPDPTLNCEQSSGQLMGNPASFPILCLANLAGYWLSLEKYLGRPVELNSLPVLINGDDILFRADTGFLQLWREVVQSLGFTLSVGKYYVHPTVCTLNSQFFLDFREIKYYNPGLLFRGFAGNKKRAHYLPVEQICEEYLSGAWNKSRAWTRFKHYWGSTLDKATRSGRLNLFLPRSAGGLGCSPLGLELNSDYYISESNRWLAWMLDQLQFEEPLVAKKLTCCPSRENLNSHNSSVVASKSKTLLWLSEPDYSGLDKRSIKYKSHKTIIANQSLAQLRPQTGQLFPTFQMGVPVRAGDPIWVPKELAASESPVPQQQLSPDSCDFEEFEQKVLTLPPGAVRVERSFTSEDKLWWRTISQSDIRKLRKRFGCCPGNLPPIPEKKTLYKYCGKFSVD